MLDLWWQITEQTYLYYWHQRIWVVLVAWAVLVLLLLLLVLVGEELWRAGYRAALRTSVVPEAPAQKLDPVLLHKIWSRSAGFLPHRRRRSLVFVACFLANASRADSRSPRGPAPVHCRGR